ncbi:hypothetical protein AB0L06_43425 [Spirillospora sp. NPDC052269]
MTGTHATAEPRLHLIGYGDWTAPTSATQVGAGMNAHAAVDDIARALGGRPSSETADPRQPP